MKRAIWMIGMLTIGCVASREQTTNEITCAGQMTADLAGTGLLCQELTADTLYPSDPAHPGAAFHDGAWAFTSGSYMYYPIATLPTEFVGYSWTVHRASPAAEVTASILELWPGGSALTVPGSKLVDATGTTGDVTLAVSGLDYAPVAGNRYVLRVAESGGDGADMFTSALLFTP